MALVVFDRETLLANLDNDEQAFAIVIESFLSAIDGFMSEVRMAVDAKDPKMLAAKAHKLKGAILNFGAKDAVHFAQLLENRGHEGLNETESQVFMALEVSIEELVDEIKSTRVVLKGAI